MSTCDECGEDNVLRKTLVTFKDKPTKWVCSNCLERVVNAEKY